MSYKQIILDRGVPVVRSLAILGLLGSGMQPALTKAQSLFSGRADTPAEIELGTRLSACMAKEVVWRNAHLDIMDAAAASLPPSASKTATQQGLAQSRTAYRALQASFLKTIQRSVPASQEYNQGNQYSSTGNYNNQSTSSR